TSGVHADESSPNLGPSSIENRGIENRGIENRGIENRGIENRGIENRGEVALDLHLEGGHSARRIVHAGDMTGREVERALVEGAVSKKNVRILDEHMAIDLITLAKYGGPEVCAGAYVLDVQQGKVVTVLARATVLATGGAGKVYLYT